MKKNIPILLVCVLLSVFCSVGSIWADSLESFRIDPDGSVVMLINGKMQKLTDYLVPVGTVQAFMGNTAPSGWLLCDGSSYDTTVYEDLFQVLQYSQGGSGSAFQVPDLRGLFLRGVDGEAGVDPDASVRTSPVDNSVVGDVVGSMQSDMLRQHNHSFVTVKDPSTVGIGTNTPQEKLDVDGQVLAHNTIIEMGENANGYYVKWANGLLQCWITDFHVQGDLQRV